MYDLWWLNVSPLNTSTKNQQLADNKGWWACVLSIRPPGSKRTLALSRCIRVVYSLSTFKMEKLCSSALRCDRATREHVPGIPHWCYLDVNDQAINELKMRRNGRFVNSIEKRPPFSLPVLDTVFTSLVIGPAAIAYWKGTWSLSDVYLFPDDDISSLIASVLFGTLVQVAFTFGQDSLQRNLRPDKYKIFYYIMSRLYTYLYGLANVNMWRGGYIALDLFCGMDVIRILVPTVFSIAILTCMKSIRNLLGTPLIVALDTHDDYFQVPTMFNVTVSDLFIDTKTDDNAESAEKKSKLSLYALDCFFSVFVIGSLVVFIWRGVWCLTDVFLFPENEKYSAFGSLAIGYVMVIIVFCLQAPIQKITERMTGYWKLIVADIYIFLSFIATINLWRGIWNLLNIYFLPEFPIWSYWITHLGCFAFLVLINCSNTVLVRGVYLDGEDGGKCVIFPIFYFTLLCQGLQTKNNEENGGVETEESQKAEEIDVEKGEKENCNGVNALENNKMQENAESSNE
ncbi:hypothetical protein RUM43_009804 [Polyplax serrata]|uniref:Uncharacterized protein n=1 Tax=Polyplax serrata TaxID=468196 RepID=A0AAN8PJU0_POLSC